MASESRENPNLLLDLPLEIRELIYGKLFEILPQGLDSDPGIESLGPVSSIIFHYPRLNDNGVVTPNRELSIYYPSALPKYRLLPILQTCRQLRSELQEYIGLLQKFSRGGSKLLGYTIELDAYEFEIFPKWTRLLLPPEPPYNFIPEFRINYNIKSFDSRVRDGRRWSREGGLKGEGMAIFNFLSDFFNHGPQGFYIPTVKSGTDSVGGSTIRIGRFVVNVRFIHSSGLGSFISRHAQITNSSGSDGDSTHMNDFSAELEDYERAIMGAFVDWFSLFLGAGHLDGLVNSAQVLWDGRDEWDPPTSDTGSYPGNVNAPGKIKGNIDLATCRERWEKLPAMPTFSGCIWGTKENFQVGSTSRKSTLPSNPLSI